MSDESLQDLYAPETMCFGCGPANPKGLRIKSRVEGDAVVLDWTPEPHHEAFPGFVNGGIIGVLFDCHCNWAAAHRLMTRAGSDTPPFTVTADYAVKLRRPTPSGRRAAAPSSRYGRGTRRIRGGRGSGFGTRDSDVRQHSRMNVMRMMITTFVVAGLSMTAFAMAQAPAAGGLQAGDVAPAFSLPGSDGATHTLASFKGQKAVVLAWFPKAFTGG